MISIVIPLFNEQENIQDLLKEVTSSVINYRNYEIILIDDGSTDNTLSIISSLNKKNIKIFKNLENSGQSFSIHKGITQSSNNIIITIDGDGQNDPKDIPKLLDFFLMNNDIDLVGGIRLKRKDNIIKIISSKIANFIRSWVLKDNCNDTGCSLKVFNKKIFLSFPYFDGMHRFLPALFKGYGCNTSFIYVNHRKRLHGKSKYGTIERLLKGIRDMVKVKKIIRNKKNIK